MTEKEALIHLGIFDEYTNDDVTEAIEKKIFDIKDFVFKNAPIYAVWQAKLNKLKLAFEAKNRLFEEPSLSKHELNFELILPADHHPIDWLQDYQRERSRLFLFLQGVEDIDTLDKGITQLLILEEQLKKHYQTWFSDWSWPNEIAHVLAKDKLDVGVLTWNLRQLIDEGAILFIEGKFEKIKEEVPFEEVLQKEFVRLNKLSF